MKRTVACVERPKKHEQLPSLRTAAGAGNRGKEIQMSDTQGAAQGDGDGARRLNTFWMVVLWLVVIVVAVFPFPWWW
jgi:hypothetical protein